MPVLGRVVLREPRLEVLEISSTHNVVEAGDAAALKETADETVPILHLDPVPLRVSCHNQTLKPQSAIQCYFLPIHPSTNNHQRRSSERQKPQSPHKSYIFNAHDQ